MLMQIEPISFSQLGTWVAIFAFLYVIYLKWEANRIAKEQVNKPNTSSPQPFVVELTKQFVTKDELNGLKVDMDTRLIRIEEKLDERLTSIDNKRDRQVAELHEKVNEANATLSYIRGKMDCMEK